MAGRPGHEEEDDAFGFGREMGLFWRKRVGDGRWRGPAVLAKQASERDGAKADTALFEEPAAGDELSVGSSVKVCLAVHRFALLEFFALGGLVQGD